MTDQDNLRNRIAEIVNAALDAWNTDMGTQDGESEYTAQAIIDELGLRVEGQMGVDGEDPIWQERVAGKWEAERCPR